MVTTSEYYELTKSSYDDSGAPSGWERLAPPDTNSNDDQAGYDGAAFRRIGSNEIVITHRGTELGRFDGDVTADVQMGLDMLPTQYIYAKEYYNQISDKYEGAEISNTGHSLGGSLAQLLGAETGIQTETFNAYGAADLIDDLNDEYFLDIDPEGNFDNINNHRSAFDPFKL